MKVQDDELFLDVGNHLSLGIIDHHHLVDSHKSATTLVLENKDFIPKNMTSIILHSSPDLDCIASSYLVEYYLKHETFPMFAKELSQFIDKIDFGSQPSCDISLYSLFTFLKKDMADEESVQLGHSLIEKLSPYGFESDTIPDEFLSIKNQILEDYQAYLHDTKNATLFETHLHCKNSDRQKRCLGIVLFEPRSLLFKEWARNDVVTSQQERGFDLLVVVWGNHRIVISVKPDDDVYLKDIGSLLNTAEKNKRDGLNIHLHETNRSGYDMPDPWYDGRAHGYTIIDSPKMGTVMMLDEILNILQNKAEHGH